MCGWVFDLFNGTTGTTGTTETTIIVAFVPEVPSVPEVPVKFLWLNDDLFMGGGRPDVGFRTAADMEEPFAGGGVREGCLRV